MGSLRLEIHLDGFNALRNSPEVVALLEELGEGIRARATGQVDTSTDDGEPFRVNTVHNRSRAVTFVATSNYDGILAEARSRALTNAVG